MCVTYRVRDHKLYSQNDKKSTQNLSYRIYKISSDALPRYIFLKDLFLFSNN